MPTYEISAPNGRTYQIDGPEGASQDQIQAEVTKQYPDASGMATPSPGTQQATSVPPGGAQAATRGNFSLGRLGQIAGQEALATPGRVLEDVKSKAVSTADWLRNPKMADVLPMLAGGPKSTAALRIGGAVAGRLMDQPPASLEEGAKTAAGAWPTAVLEAAVPVFGKVLRSLPNNPFIGGRANIAAQETARTGQVAAEISPGLQPGLTVQELRQAAVQAPKRLGTAKEEAVTRLESSLATATDPTVPRSGRSFPDPLKDYTETGPIAPAGKFMVPSANPTQAMTLREANEELSRVGDMIRGRTPLDPKYSQANLTQVYGQIAQDIESGLMRLGGQHAVDAWKTLQGEYKSGRALIKPFQTGAAYRPGQTASEMELNTPFLQRWLLNPKNEAALRSRLTDQQFQSLAHALTGGGGVGSASVLAPSANVTGALMEILRGKGGATQIPALVPRTLLPQLGSRYAGTPPYTTPPALQTILDLAGQKGAGTIP